MGFFNWAAPLVSRYGDRWSEEEAEQVADWLRPAVGSGGRVLDVGGGSGQLARHLARSLEARVTVLDPTPEMLERLSRSHAVEGVLGSAEKMPFDASAFDALVVTDAFHHFRDQSAAVHEFARVVRSGGTVVVLDLDPTGLAMRMIALAERLAGEPATFHTPDGMCAFMAEHGIGGECTRMRGASYRFTGTVLARVS